jgi:hypothetical protein
MISNVSLSGISNVSMPASPAPNTGDDSGGLDFGDVLQNAVSDHQPAAGRERRYDECDDRS